MSLRSLLCGALSGVAVLATYATISNAPPAMAAPSASGCGASSAPVSAHYSAAVGPDHVGYISAVNLSGFDAGCEGNSAVLQLWGNQSGDPTVPMSGDSLLATIDSTLDPCTQRPLQAALKVQNGNLDLTLCPTGGRAGYVSIHDLTAVALSVNGQTVPVVSSASSGSQATAHAVAPGGILAFTGANLVLLAIVGALALVLGMALALLFRRRERQRVPPSLSRWDVRQ